MMLTLTWAVILKTCCIIFKYFAMPQLWLGISLGMRSKYQYFWKNYPKWFQLQSHLATTDTEPGQNQYLVQPRIKSQSQNQSTGPHL